ACLAPRVGVPLVNGDRKTAFGELVGGGHAGDAAPKNGDFRTHGTLGLSSKNRNLGVLTKSGLDRCARVLAAPQGNTPASRLLSRFIGGDGGPGQKLVDTLVSQRTRRAYRQRRFF